ncbi:MAG: hypothetical protein LBC89_00250, partial [Bacteroidales bacterium]|nr:hypothetical protein [Bacteroidales bacterium]
MKIKSLITKLSLFLALCSLLFSCKNNNEHIISKPEIGKIPDEKLTAEILWSFGRLGEFAVSPDEKTIAYTITYYDIAENKGNTEIYLMDINGSNKRQLTKTAKSEYNIAWLTDKILIYLYSGKLYKKEIHQDNAEEIVGAEGLEGFKISPDGKKILFAKCVPANFSKAEPQLFEGLDKTTGRIIEDLAYRHWDGWVDEIPHLFVADFDLKGIANEKDLLEGQMFEAPSRPWGGMEETDWSTNSKKVAYCVREKIGKEYAFSTNTDIFIYDLEEQKSHNISAFVKGYDKNPRFSVDGKSIVWEAMRRDGYEADHIQAILMKNFTVKEPSLKESNKVVLNAEEMIVKTYEADITSMQWSDDGSKIYFLAPWQGRSDIFTWDVKSGDITRITNGIHEYTAFQKLKNGGFIGSQMSTMYPAEIFSIDE